MRRYPAEFEDGLFHVFLLFVPTELSSRQHLLPSRTYTTRCLGCARRSHATPDQHS
jgi:hypothetical protein